MSWVQSVDDFLPCCIVLRYVIINTILSVTILQFHCRTQLFPVINIDSKNSVLFMNGILLLHNHHKLMAYV